MNDCGSICERCGKGHDGSFGSGRFCSRSCANARSFTRITRKRISETLNKKEKVGPSEEIIQKAIQVNHNNWLKRKAKIKTFQLDVTNEFLEQYRNDHPVCEMCGNLCSTGRKLAVDHDHKTGKFRGLLCMKCNRHLGWYESNKEKVDDYLGTHVPR